MEENFHYGTVTEAVSDFKSKGYSLDFNLEENCIVCENTKFDSDEFEIVEVYRYEGESDPADEAAVYAIESKTGKKGILVTGYGVSADNVSPKLFEKLKYRKK